MMLIYTNEAESLNLEEMKAVAEAHGAVMADAGKRGILRGADPLEPTSCAKTVRVDRGKVMVTDGPFAETKEQLAGYYILDCKDFDEVLAWAARIPSSCGGGAGCVEIRPIRAVAQDVAGAGLSKVREAAQVIDER